jgi:hypothetical protein
MTSRILVCPVVAVMLNSLSDGGVYEGAFASIPRFINGQARMPSASPTAGGFVAQAGGTIAGRFGWGNNASHQVANTRSSDHDQIGVVLPLASGYGAGVIGFGRSWQFYDPLVRAFRIRQGINITLMTRGDFWLRFAGGAYTGMPVYASLVDGAALSGETDNAELTPWVVCSNAPPGCLAIVSTNARFGA